MKKRFALSALGILALILSVVTAPLLGGYYQFSITVCIFFLIGTWVMKNNDSFKEKLIKTGFLIFPFLLIYTLLPRIFIGIKGVQPISFLIDWAPFFGVLMSLTIKRPRWAIPLCAGILLIGQLIAINFSLLMDGRHSWVTKTTIEAPSLQTLDAKKIDIPSFKGKTIVLDFWFRGCKPCEQSMPDFERLYASLKNNPDVKIISVLGLDRENFKRDSVYLKTNFEYTFPVLMDVDWKFSEFFSVGSFPCLIIIDSESYVRYQGGFNPKWYHMIYNTKKIIKKINHTQM